MQAPLPLLLGESTMWRRKGNPPAWRARAEGFGRQQTPNVAPAPQPGRDEPSRRARGATWPTVRERRRPLRLLGPPQAPRWLPIRQNIATDLRQAAFGALLATTLEPPPRPTAFYAHAGGPAGWRRAYYGRVWNFSVSHCHRTPCALQAQESGRQRKG